MKNKIPMVFGYRTAAKASPGLKDLYFGSPNKPYIQVVGRDGNVVGLKEVDPLRPDQYVAVDLPITAQVGLPFISGFVQDAAKPQSIEVMYWPDMVAKVLASYPSMRNELCKHHPEAGMVIANFILGLAPKWAAKSHPVDFERFTEAVRTLGLYWLLLNQPHSGNA